MVPLLTVDEYQLLAKKFEFVAPVNTVSPPFVCSGYWDVFPFAFCKYEEKFLSSPQTLPDWPPGPLLKGLLMFEVSPSRVIAEVVKLADITFPPKVIFIPE